MTCSPVALTSAAARWLTIVPLTLLLAACGGESFTDSQRCEPFETLTPYCDFQSPEDLVIAPDGTALVISEFGQMGEVEGQLTLFDLSSEERYLLYNSASSNDQSLGNPLWGDSDCAEPETFSPHGIDLSQRPSGRWQLLVVNHGERETIDMFELLRDDNQRWQLAWRGCAEAIDDSSFNDVAAVGDGFVTTRMISRTAGLSGMLDYFLGRDTGWVWHWSLANGFQQVPGTMGVMPNGILASADGQQLYVNMYGQNLLQVIDRASGELVRETELVSADNSNWDVERPGKILVASHEFNFMDMTSCMTSGSANCSVEFEIIELDTQTLQKTTLLRADGAFFGGGTAAVRVGDDLYIGSFAGTRLLKAPVGYGVTR